MDNPDFFEHEHKHGENCDCEHTISIPLEDGTELVCDILGTFDLEETSYIVLLPQGEEEIVIYKYNEESNEQITLTPIESDEELERVADVFYELYSDGDFEYDDDLDDEEDLDDDDDFEDDEEDFDDEDFEDEEDFDDDDLEDDDDSFDDDDFEDDDDFDEDEF